MDNALLWKLFKKKKLHTEKLTLLYNTGSVQSGGRDGDAGMWFWGCDLHKGPFNFLSLAPVGLKNEQEMRYSQ